jgi:hypothetical protein
MSKKLSNTTTMKKIYHILSVASLALVPCLLPAQRVFTPSEKQTIDSRTDSIVYKYQDYATFIKDVDDEKISEEYVEGFKKLFVSPDAEVINDLDYTKKTPTRIPVSKYIEYVRKWYPGGFSVSLKIRKKNPPESAGKNQYNMVINVTKELKGVYNNDKQQYYKAPLNIVVQFNDQLSSFRILKIEDTIGSDKCRQLREMGSKYLKENDFKNARSRFAEALEKYCPSDAVSLAGIKVADSGVEANKKALNFLVHVIPGYSMFNVKVVESPQRTVNSFSSESGLVLSGGLGLELCVLKSHTGRLSVGLTFDYAQYTSTLKAEGINEQVPKMTDIDNDTVTLLHSLTGVSEKNTISYIQVPLYAKYDLAVSKALYLYGKLGVKAGLSISKNYSTTVATGDFSGLYPQYGGIILWGNELSEYGYGTYQTLSGSGDNGYYSTLNLSALVGVGITATLSKSVELFAGVEFDYGFSDLALTKDNYYVSGGKSTFNSLYGMTKASVSSVSVDIGINIKIFKY